VAIVPGGSCPDGSCPVGSFPVASCPRELCIIGAGYRNAHYVMGLLKKSRLLTLSMFRDRAVVLNLSSTTPPLSNCPLFQATLAWNKL